MRFVKFMMIAVLVLSLAGNFMLYQRVLQRRVQVTVNGEPIRKKDFYDFMEQHYGRKVTADMVRYLLIKQAAMQAGVMPDRSEIDRMVQEIRDTNPSLALNMKLYPWTEADVRRESEETLALVGLMTKDVKATDDEIKTFFSLKPGAWDKPDRIHLKAILAADAESASKVKQLMERMDDMIVAAGQLPGKAVPIGADGTYVVQKPVGKPSTDRQVNAIAAMRPGEVKSFPSGRNVLVVKMMKFEPGKKVTLEEVKDRVARDFKMTRRTPKEEVLRKLWDEANIQTEDPRVKAEIERILFPQSAERPQVATKP